MPSAMAQEQPLDGAATDLNLVGTPKPEWGLELVALPGPPAHLTLADGAALDQVRVTTVSGQLFGLEACDQTYCLRSFGKMPRLVESPEVLKGSVIAFAAPGSGGDIGSVWLADPVQRLGDGTLGAENAATLVVKDRSAMTHRLELPIDQAFEDLAPRLVDLDGDKEPEIIVTKATVGSGASLSVVKFSPDGFHVVALSAPEGGPNAWLKLAGIADFNGDKSLDLAVVRQPGPEGSLELWNYVPGYLQPVMAAADFSNHVTGVLTKGSAITEMSVSGDFNGDGVADLAIPSADRMTLRLVSFRDGAITEFGRQELPAAITTDILALPSDGKRPALIMGLEDGSLAVLGRPSE